jgi:hypothetical protein
MNSVCVRNTARQGGGGRGNSTSTHKEKMTISRGFWSFSLKYFWLLVIATHKMIDVLVVLPENQSFSLYRYPEIN